MEVALAAAPAEASAYERAAATVIEAASDVGEGDTSFYPLADVREEVEAATNACRVEVPEAMGAHNVAVRPSACDAADGGGRRMTPAWPPSDELKQTGRAK